MRARYRVTARLDGAGGASPGTVTIDRASGLVEVRPLRRRRTYVVTLESVATWVCQVVIRAELAEKRAAKKAKRRRV